MAEPAIGTALRGDRRAVAARRWRPGGLTIVIAVLALGGLGAGLYPMTAAWITSYNQSRVLVGYETAIADVEPSAEEQLRQAREYNDALSAGVVLGENANIPVGDGTLSDDSLDYTKILSANAAGLMARVKIPRIDVDLPVYHGTSDAVLARGAGHLEGSHLPVGGIGTRSVITAHRGLANATMFTDLDRVEVGDTITVETFGRVLTYRVRETKVIEPDQTDTLRAEPGEDLVTLITCTPLGINTHRILVTGERITPTPEADLSAAGQAPVIPGFPWWAVLGGGGALLVAAYVARQGFADARMRMPRDTATHETTKETHGDGA
ncbi:class C sortase [Microbacterium sp. SSW1-49]|uniref:Class C sortase n=2 Tax=Microbacterium croceum TaxID=2851645 RepID=A0ABT0FAN5_9MICO|nr:class C sortase [Microbacterium croceum]